MGMDLILCQYDECCITMQCTASKLVPLLKEGSRRGKFRKAVLAPLKSVKFLNKLVKKRYLGEH